MFVYLWGSSNVLKLDVLENKKRYTFIVRKIWGNTKNTKEISLYAHNLRVGTLLRVRNFLL